jgi:hypothetical protein
MQKVLELSNASEHSCYGARYPGRVLTSLNSSNELFCALNVLQQSNKRVTATLELPNCENSVTEQ